MKSFLLKLVVLSLLVVSEFSFLLMCKQRRNLTKHLRIQLFIHRQLLKKLDCVLAQLYEASFDVIVAETTIDFLVDWASDEKSSQKKFWVLLLVTLSVRDTSVVGLHDTVVVVKVTIELEESWSALFVVTHFGNLVMS